MSVTKPITVIWTNSIRAGFDAHFGYGAPVGCVLTSPTQIYSGPVGVDIKCSISFLLLDLPADRVVDKMGCRAPSGNCNLDLTRCFHSRLQPLPHAIDNLLRRRLGRHFVTQLFVLFPE